MAAITLSIAHGKHLLRRTLDENEGVIFMVVVKGCHVFVSGIERNHIGARPLIPSLGTLNTGFTGKRQ
jgi:hypothetical protein